MSDADRHGVGGVVGGADGALVGAGGADGPNPPRYKWLKRAGVGVGLALVALGGLRAWWGWHAERVWQRAVAAARADRWPFDEHEFAAPDVALRENAAMRLGEAAAAIQLPPGMDIIALSDVVVSPSLLRERRDEVARLFEANRQVIALVQQARACPSSDWHIKWTTPKALTMAPGTSAMRDLARFLNAAAHYRHAIGEDGHTVERLDDILEVTRRWGEHQPFVIAHLVALAIERLMTESVEELAADLCVSADAGGLAYPGAATDAQVRRLIERLLDEQPLRRALVHALAGERLMQFDLARLVSGDPTVMGMAMGTGPPGGGVMGRIGALAVGPMIKLDGARLLADSGAMLRAAEAKAYPDVLALLPGERPMPRSGFAGTTRLLSHNLQSNKRVFDSHYRAIGTRRMAAIALALRLYQVEHGAWPADLAALAPDYLPEVPRDPFAEDGRAIAYLPAARPPRLYCVGIDGVDDGGAFEIGSHGFVDVMSPDLVFFLDGQRPRPPERRLGGLTIEQGPASSGPTSRPAPTSTSAPASAPASASTSTPASASAPPPTAAPAPTPDGDPESVEAVEDERHVIDDRRHADQARDRADRQQQRQQEIHDDLAPQLAEQDAAEHRP